MPISPTTSSALHARSTETDAASSAPTASEPRAAPTGTYTPEPSYHPEFGVRAFAATGTAVDGGQDIPFTQNTSGKSQQPIDKDLALLANDVYSTEATVVTGPDGREWSRLSDQQLAEAGIDPSLLDGNYNGFEAAIYTDGEGNYVLAFAGTDSALDGIEDVNQLYGESSQYTQAVELGKQAQAAFGDNLVMTGHSLGGGLASLAALATGSTAVTFNPAGISDETFANAGLDPEQARAAAADGQVRAYAVEGEALTSIQDSTPLPDTVGAKIVLNDPTPVSLQDYMNIDPDHPEDAMRIPTADEIAAYELAEAADSVPDHSMSAVLEAMELA